MKVKLIKASVYFIGLFISLIISTYLILLFWIPPLTITYVNIIYMGILSFIVTGIAYICGDFNTRVRGQ